MDIFRHRRKHISDVASIQKSESKKIQKSGECISLVKIGLNAAKAKLIRQSTEQFINILFWHSLLMTLTTPLARFFRGRWSSASLLYWCVIVFFWVRYGLIDSRVKEDSEEPYIDESFVYKSEKKAKGIDFAFGLHAFGGLFWLLTAWIQMSLLKTSKKWHRTFGFVAIAAFILHMFAALNNLYFNYMRHTPLPRLMLGLTTVDSIICMVTAMIRVRRKDYQGHRDAMLRCFLYSIEGAGTIRTVATLQAFLGLGPTECQMLANGFSTNCMYSYTWRLLFTRYLSLGYLGLYTVHRDNKNYTRSFLIEFLCWSLISVCLLNPMRMEKIDLMCQLFPYHTISTFLGTFTIARVLILRASCLK